MVNLLKYKLALVHHYCSELYISAPLIDSCQLYSYYSANNLQESDKVVEIAHCVNRIFATFCSGFKEYT